ncbi:MAG: histidyl-tRNA synthetase [Erysipelotrichaceae bacterium]|nr:MAG: histidyl-tRNA [Erysipelotrichaceae bacterium]TXT17843.1 MAG: histidyl-tRNA synthetase [Erysipelotrichaceae bacterium]
MANYQVPRGTQDLFGSEIQKWQRIELLIRQLSDVFGYEEIRTPEFEHTEVFKRENDSSDVVNKEMYTFMDRGERSLTLKPEGTAGIIRSFVEHKMYSNPDMPYKFFYLSPCFRYERPQKGRMRIHHQFGIEVIGDKNPMIDAEVISLGLSLVQTLGMKDLKVLINTLGDSISRESYKKALVEHFKEPISHFCGDCQRRYEQNPLRILDCKIDHEDPAMINAPKLIDYLNDESKTYFNSVLTILKASDIDVEVNDKLVRGLDYYTHTVFEVVSVNADMGSQSTVFGGGRYDDLVKDFGGPELSGIGFGMGIERLLVALEAEKIDLSEEESSDVYIVSIGQEASDYAYQLSNFLRLNGFVTHFDYYQRSFKAQFKTAERKKAKVVIIIGEDEMKKGQVVLKNIATQEQRAVDEGEILHQLAHWLDENHIHHEENEQEGETHE